jgi:hypothetical protein
MYIYCALFAHLIMKICLIFGKWEIKKVDASGEYATASYLYFILYSKRVLDIYFVVFFLLKGLFFYDNWTTIGIVNVPNAYAKDSNI